MPESPLIDTKIVAFLDVLGYRNIADKFERGDYVDFYLLRDAIGEAMGEFHGVFAKLIKFEPDETAQWRKTNIQFRTFSDCICITAPLESNEIGFLKHLRNFLKTLAFFQTIMLRFGGYLIRGGVSIGKFYSDSNMIFSKGLVEAYELESKTAIYPRILIGKSVQDRVSEELSKTDELLSSFPLFTSFEDDLVFINFLNVELVDFPAYEKLNDVQRGLVDDIEIGWREKTIMAPVIEDLVTKRSQAGLDSRVVEKYDWMLRFIYNEMQRKERQIGF